MKKFLIIILLVLYVSFSYGSLIDKVNDWIKRIIINNSNKIENALLDKFNSKCGTTSTSLLRVMVINSVLAMLISMALSVIFSFINTTFGMQNEAKSIITVKLSNIIISVLTIISVYILLMVLAAPGQFGFMNASIEYIITITSKLTLYGGALAMGNTALSYISQLQISLPLHKSFIFSFSLNFYQITKPLLDALFYISNFLNLAIGEWLLKFIFLCLINKYALTLLFPFGIFLRSFNLTKGAGDALIAISLAFYIVYPFFLSMSFAFYKSIENAFNLRHISVINSVGRSVASVIVIGAMAGITGKLASTYGHKIFKLLGLTGEGVKESTNIINSLISLIKTGFNIATSWVAIGLTFYLASNMFLKLIPSLIYLIVIYSLLLSAFNVYATLVFSRELSKILGSQISFSEFMKLI